MATQEVNRVARIDHQFGDLIRPYAQLHGSAAICCRRLLSQQSGVDSDRFQVCELARLAQRSFESRLPIREGQDALVVDSELQAVKAGVLTLASEKLFVRSFFNDAPLVQDNNAVGEPHGR